MNPRQLLTLILAPLQFAASAFHPLTGLGRSVGDMAQDAPTAATPAGYAFAIWMVIFTLATLYALHQARPEQRHNPLYTVIGWPLVAAMGAGSVWMLYAQLFGNGLGLLVLIVIMACCILGALLVGTRHHPRFLAGDTVGKFIVSPMLGLFGGWLTLAVFLNLGTSSQILLGWPNVSHPVPSMFLLLGAATAGLTVLYRVRHSYVAAQAYGLTLLWGLAAVMLANTASGPFSSAVASFPVGVVGGILAAAVMISLFNTDNKAT